MTIKYEKIPKKFQVGGQEINVRYVEELDNNNLGECCVCGGYIEIAHKCGKDLFQSEGCKENTFYHELMHSILRTAGYFEHDKDEQYVCTISSLLCEAMKNAYFMEETEE